MVVRAQSYEPFVAAVAADAAAAAASALSAEGSADAAEGFAGDAQDYAAGVVSLLRLYWLPGHEPDVVSLDPVTYGVLWSAYTEQVRVDALEAAGSFTFRQYWLPGVSASSAPWLLDDDGAILFQPPEGGGGATASDLASTRDATTKLAVPNWLATKYLYVAMEGQSLVIGGGTYTPYLYNTTALSPGKIVMPSVGLKPSRQTWTTFKDAVDEYYNNSDISIGNNPTGALQTQTVALLNQLYTEINTDTGIEPLIIGVVNGAGGTSIQDLGPGSGVGEASLLDMERARDAAEALGTSIGDMICVWIHGNEDMGVMTGPQYKQWLISRQKWHTEAARRIFGITGEVVYFVEQNTAAKNTFGDCFEVVQAHYELCRDDRDRFQALEPCVDVDHPDGTHMYSAGYHIRDVRHGRNIARRKYAGGHDPFAATNAWMTGATTGTIRVEIPPLSVPMVIDFSDNSFDATITIAAPGVFTKVTHGIYNGAVVYLTTTGALPTGLSAGVRYYVVNRTDDTFELSLTSGGAAIDTTGSQSGTHTVVIQGWGIQFDDDSGAPPYITDVAILDDGSSAGGGANDPLGYGLLSFTLSAAPAAYGRLRLLMGQQQTPGTTNQGGPGGARVAIRDSLGVVSTIDRDGATSDYTANNWMMRNVLPVSR